MTFTRFFKPNEEIERRLSGFRAMHNLGEKIVIGLHIRSGGDFRKPMTDKDWIQFRDCAEVMTTRVKNRKSKHGVNVDNQDVVWLVVTDTQDARNRSTKEFSRNTHEADVLFYDNFLASNTKQGVQNAFMDMLLVTFADARVLTPCSSYSEFAYVMSGATGDSVFVKSSRVTVDSLEPSFEELQDMLKKPCPK
jgi:hypothetical protein